jgi:large exoprotein involved in heme utilization and adhesion
MSIGRQLYLLGSDITASAGGVTATDNGGNIAINQPLFFILNRSTILAQANFGTGGNIDIVGDFVLNSTDSLVDASSLNNVDGVVTIDSRNDVTGTVIDLQVPFIDVSELLRQRCLPQELRDRSSFTEEGRGGVRRAPSSYATSPIETYIDALPGGLGVSTRVPSAGLNLQPVPFDCFGSVAQ